MKEIEISKLEISSFNVRKSSVEITELIDSIKSQGIIQPLLVRPVGDKFEVVVGQRRFLAACQAGLKKVPVIIKKMSDEDALKASLTENIHREDLDPIDKAKAIKELVFIEKNKGKSMRDSVSIVAKDLGLGESTIWDNLSLLGLEKEVKEKVKKGKISVTVASRLKTIPPEKQVEVAKEIEGLPRTKAIEIIRKVKEKPRKVKEIKEEIEKEYTFRISFNKSEGKALEKATEEMGIGNIVDAIRVIVVDWLANKGFLKSKKEIKKEEIVQETEEEIETWKQI